MRKRDCESTVTIEYLRNLWQAYEEFLTEIARIIPVIRVNYEEFHTADEMADVIIREYSQMCSVRYVDFQPAEKKLKPASYGVASVQV